MSIRIGKLAYRQLYEHAREGEGAWANTRYQKIAATTDDAVDAMMAVFRDAGIPFPNDDRAEEVVNAVFAAAIKFNSEGN